MWAGESLLTTLRDRLRLPGSKNACEQGECGSCSVLLDGTLVCSCLVLAAQADGHEVVTVEGLADGDRLHPGAGCVRRSRRGPVRLLHAGARRRDCGSAPPFRGPDGRRDSRGALREPLPLHRVPEDPRRCAPGGWRVSAPTRTLQRGHAAATAIRARRRAQGEGRVRIFERPPRGRDALGPDRPQPARSRADPRNRCLRLHSPCPESMRP